MADIFADLGVNANLGALSSPDLIALLNAVKVPMYCQ